MIEEEVEDLEELGEDEPEQEQEMYEHFRLEVPAKIYCALIGFWSIGYPTYPVQKYRKLQRPNVYRSITNR